MLLFVTGILAYQRALPVLEGNDELWHYNYVNWLRLTWRLPDRSTPLTNPMRQETGQPPLRYGLDALIFDTLGLPTQGLEGGEPGGNGNLSDVSNPWFTPPDWSNRRDNFNLFFHGQDERGFGHPDIVLDDRVGRLISVFYAMLAFTGGYGIARECFRRSQWVWTATIFYAFTPTMLYMAAQLSNDIASTAFATLALWQTLVLLRRGATSKRILIVAILASLAGLSKISGLIILPGILLALAFEARRGAIISVPFPHLPGGKGPGDRGAISRFARNALLLLIVVAILFGPWMAFGLITYRDPLGLRTHGDPGSGILPGPTPLTVLADMPQTFMSYWAKFGTSSVWLNYTIYGLFAILVIFSVSGYIAFWRRKDRSAFSWHDVSIQSALIGATVAILAFAALLYWLLTLFTIAYAITARLAYFAQGVIAPGLLGGLYLLTWHKASYLSRLARLASIGLLLGVGLVLSPMTIYSIYAEPVLLNSNQLPSLSGGPIDFDHAVRFLGYDTSLSRVISQGTSYRARLCWQVLKPTTRNAAFSVKLFGPSSKDVGGRTSIPGLGHFPSALWRVGDTFCDLMDVPVNEPLVAGQVYNEEVVVSDARKGNANWTATTPGGQAVETPIVGQVSSPAGDMSATLSDSVNWQHAAISFPQLADLGGYSVEGVLAAGQTFKLNVLWLSNGSIRGDWHEFIHLVNASSSLSLGDGPPRQGNYPTWAWSTGEKIAESWTLTLPADLASGDYSVQIGFYNPTTGERLIATKDGISVPDRSVPLVTLHLGL